MSNLPTLVFGTSSMNTHRSGSHHRLTRSVRKTKSSSGVADDPSSRTTATIGRSLHRSSGTAMTAASTTSGWAITSFSSSTEEIHSPPDLMTSLVRSLICMNPLRSSDPMSPVRSQPSWKRSGAGSP